MCKSNLWFANKEVTNILRVFISPKSNEITLGIADFPYMGGSQKRCTMGGDHVRDYYSFVVNKQFEC